MDDSKSKSSTLKVLEEVKNKLSEIELYCLDYTTKEKVHNLISFIEDETTNSKTVFADMIYDKVKETHGVSSELNINFYLLYRNLQQDKISLEAARRLYDMYVKDSE
jgi:hypothetical protein